MIKESRVVMFNIGTGVVVGIAVFAMRMYDIYKNRKAMKTVMQNREFQVFRFNVMLMYLMFILVLPSAWTAYQGFTIGNELNAGLGILLVFLFLAEGINALDVTKLYYNETGCIIYNQFVRYKSMKSVKRKYPIPFSKHILATYKFEKFTINEPVSKFLQEKGIPLVHKQD